MTNNLERHRYEDDCHLKDEYEEYLRDVVGRWVLSIRLQEVRLRRVYIDEDGDFGMKDAKMIIEYGNMTC
ncbi:hypothetical protein HK097_009348 [Rhizophlyctis rosea]|uniref:Uncharacterized protein n=1 Tax=Rhizophlyctis rosea TaxID=64517 RepID=A0AAD5SAN5_9FUNG|nr:hypothetical protein HK097_009348 [Rhizophlyctis rosea]